MSDPKEKQTLQQQVKESAIDVRNEAIAQTANLYLLVRKVLLTSLGALALSADEAREFLERLVERGEVAEQDVQRMINELRRSDPPEEQGSADTPEAAPTTSAAKSKRSVAGLEENVEGILMRLNVPTRNDIEALSEKITELNRKVSLLREQETMRRTETIAEANPVARQEPVLETKPE